MLSFLLSHLRRQRPVPGRKLALLAVLGMLMVATPIAQLWRHHGSELAALLDARLALRPIQWAIATHRALIEHRPLAAAVLRGLHEQESARLERQAVVDGHLTNLAAALVERRHYRALDEAHGMQDGWHQLRRGIVQRSLSASASDQAHELLIEQSMVIVDLESTANGLLGRVIGPQTWRLASREVPRLQAALAHWQAAQQQPDVSRRARAGERLQSAAVAVVQVLGTASHEEHEPATRRAALALELATRELGAGLVSAGNVAHAQRAADGLQEVLAPLQDQQLVQEIQAHQRQASWLLVCAVVALLGWLAAIVWTIRRLAQPARSSPRESPDSGISQPPQPPESRAPADHLLERLRKMPLAPAETSSVDKPK